MLRGHEMTPKTAKSPNSLDSSDILNILKMEYEKSYERCLYLDDQANKCFSTLFTAIGIFAGIFAVVIGNTNFKSDAKVDVINLDSDTINLMVYACIIVVGLILIFAMHHTTQCFRVGGYIKHLEEKINTHIGSDILAWEGLIRPCTFFERISEWPVVVIVFAIFFAVLALGFHIFVDIWRSFIPDSFAYVLVAGVLLIVELAVIVFSFVTAVKAHEKTYNAAKAKMMIE